MKIKNKQLDIVFKIVNYPMKFSLARKRDNFLKALGEKIDAKNNDIEKLYKEYCIKDEKGNPVIQDNRYQFDDSVLEDLNKDFAEIMNEDVEIPHEPIINDIIVNSNVELEVGEGLVMEEILANKNKTEPSANKTKKAKKAKK